MTEIFDNSICKNCKYLEFFSEKDDYIYVCGKDDTIIDIVMLHCKSFVGSGSYMKWVKKIINKEL